MYSGCFVQIWRIFLSRWVRTFSGTVPGISRNDDFGNREPSGDRSLNDPYPEVEFSVRQASNLVDSDQEETSHSFIII